MASTNTTSFGYDLETVPGTTNATPDFQLLPVTSNDVGSTLTTVMSEAIRDDRQTDALIVTDKEVAGSTGFELSYAAWKPIIISLMQNTTTGSVAETACTALTAGNVVQKTSIHSALDIGATIRLTSATESDNDGIYIVTDNTTNDEVTVTPTFPATASASDYVVTITTSVANGSSVPDSYTVRTTMDNTASTTFYKYARGCQVASMSLDIATGSLITGSIGWTGLTEEVTSTAISGETEVAVAGYEVLSGAASVGSVYVNGLTLATCSFSNVSLSIDNSINSAKNISNTLGSCALASFTLQVTLDVTMYFNSIDNYNVFLNSTSFSIAFFLEDTAGTTTNNAIGFAFNNCRFESFTSNISGRDAFLEESGTIRALRDTTTDSTVQVYFVDAV